MESSNPLNKQGHSTPTVLWPGEILMRGLL